MNINTGNERLALSSTSSLASPRSSSTGRKFLVLEKSDHSHSSFLSSQFSTFSCCFNDTLDDGSDEDQLPSQRGAALYLSQVLGELPSDGTSPNCSETHETISSMRESITSLPSLSTIHDEVLLLQGRSGNVVFDDSITTLFDAASITSSYREDRVAISPRKPKSFVLVIDRCAGTNKIHWPQETNLAFEKKDLRWCAESSDCFGSGRPSSTLPSLQIATGAHPKPSTPSRDESPSLVKRTS
jgi:hypothetical protein